MTIAERHAGEHSDMQSDHKEVIPGLSAFAGSEPAPHDPDEEYCDQKHHDHRASSRLCEECCESVDIETSREKKGGGANAASPVHDYQQSDGLT